MNDRRGVIIALSNQNNSEKIKSGLTTQGYDVQAICNSGHELIRKVRQLSPDIVVMGYKLTDMTIIEVYNVIGDICCFLAVVNEPYKAYVQEATDIFCISSPINNTILINSIDIIIQSERKINKLKEKVNSLEVKIKERKTVERSKGILMKELGLSEEDAYRYIQKRSMDNGLKLTDIAECIIEGGGGIIEG